MANTLHIRQNEDVILKCLVAQRKLYTCAKYWSYVPMIIVAVMAIIVLFSSSIGSVFTGETWVSAIITFFLWVIAFAGEQYVGNLKLKASRIQQYIDREIFKEAFSPQQLILWRDVPSSGELAEAIQNVDAEAIQKQHVRDWYSNYSSLSPQEAVFRSQKENIRWDWGLRVIMITLMLLALGAVFIVVIAKVWNLKVCDCLSALIASTGIGVVVGKLLFRLGLDLYRLTLLNTTASVIEGKLNVAEGVDSELLRMQNLIYDHRHQGVLIPDWLYRIRRCSIQQSEDAIAKAHEVLVVREGV